MLADFWTIVFEGYTSIFGFFMADEVKSKLTEGDIPDFKN